jgi:hypothetical protein
MAKAEALLPVLPLLAGLVWLANILTLLVLWTTNGAPEYKVGNPAVVYSEFWGVRRNG